MFSHFRITYFSYDNGDITQKTIYKLIEPDLEYAEDLIIDVCKEINVGPVARHLFSLYCPKSKVWLALNQKLSELDSSLKDLQLRIRFKPYDLYKLVELDKSALNYYYCQVRDAFRKTEIEDTGRLLGLIITDMLIYILAKKIPLKHASDYCSSLANFYPLPCKSISKILKTCKWPLIENHLVVVYQSTRYDNDGLGQSYFTKKEFINEIVNHEKTIIPELGYETFPITSRSEICRGSSQTHEYLLQFRPFGSLDLFLAKKSKSPDWKHLCSISDICFIIVQDTELEISRKNGIPIHLSVHDKWIMKSLLSLLEGYHRLTTGGSMCICENVIPRSIQLYKEIRCHGPIGYENSVTILKDKGQEIIGSYLIRQHEITYEYIIDIWTGVSVKSIRVIPSLKKLAVLIDNELIATYMTFDSLQKELKIPSNNNKETINLKLCIPPLGSNIFSWGILCGNSEIQRNEHSPEISLAPLNFRTYLEKEIKTDGSFRYYVISFKGERLLVKEPIETGNRRFLEKLNLWSNLTADLISKTRFISIDPLAFITDYFLDEPLDEFLQKFFNQISIHQLLECAMYLSEALCYLHENNVVHGMIRCCSLFVVDRSAHPIRVRLGDPFRHLDENNDRLWIPKEYSSSSKNVPLSVDIFATATTFWEIFSFGHRPPGSDVYSLSRPLSCPSSIWKLIQKCWLPNPEQRPYPLELHRDIRELLLCEYQTRDSVSSSNHHTYTSKSKRSSKFLSNIGKLYEKLTYRPPSGYNYRLDDDIDSTSTETEDESWIIPVSNLEVCTFNGRPVILGSGNYGEVVKARYIAGSDTFVAVKRINSRARQRFAGQNSRIFGDMEREFQIMTKLDHPNIVNVIGIVKDPEIMVVMEFIELGSLVSFLRKIEPKDVNSIPIKKYIQGIVRAMEYLESLGIVHRDLAARNILMSTRDTVKISDFGLAQSLGPEEHTYFVKTIRYLPFKWYAPESIRADPIFTHKSDVWSFGVTLWEIFSLGDTPNYPGINNNSPTELYRYLDRGGTLPKPTKNIPYLETFWPVMLKCWKKFDLERPNFSQLRAEIDSSSSNYESEIVSLYGNG